MALSAITFQQEAGWRPSTPCDHTADFERIVEYRCQFSSLVLRCWALSKAEAAQPILLVPVLSEFSDICYTMNPSSGLLPFLTLLLGCLP